MPRYTDVEKKLAKEFIALKNEASSWGWIADQMNEAAQQRGLECRKFDRVNIRSHFGSKRLRMGSTVTSGSWERKEDRLLVECMSLRVANQWTLVKTTNEMNSRVNEQKLDCRLFTPTMINSRFNRLKSLGKIADGKLIESSAEEEVIEDEDEEMEDEAEEEVEGQGVNQPAGPNPLGFGAPPNQPANTLNPITSLVAGVNTLPTMHPSLPPASGTGPKFPLNSSDLFAKKK